MPSSIHISARQLESYDLRNGLPSRMRVGEAAASKSDIKDWSQLLNRKLELGIGHGNREPFHGIVVIYQHLEPSMSTAVHQLGYLEVVAFSSHARTIARKVSCKHRCTESLLYVANRDP